MCSVPSYCELSCALTFNHYVEEREMETLFPWPTKCVLQVSCIEQNFSEMGSMCEMVVNYKLEFCLSHMWKWKPIYYAKCTMCHLVKTPARWHLCCVYFNKTPFHSQILTDHLVLTPACFCKKASKYLDSGSVFCEYAVDHVFNTNGVVLVLEILLGD